MKIISLAISKKKATRKQVINEALLVKNHGIKGDAHAGAWQGQVSFLSSESIEEARQGGLDVSLGVFAETIATGGIDRKTVPIGTRAKLGDSASGEITQTGRECHTKCAIYYKAGDCIMPNEGVFAKVLEGGTIRCGDKVEILPLEH